MISTIIDFLMMVIAAQAVVLGFLMIAEMWRDIPADDPFDNLCDICEKRIGELAAAIKGEAPNE
jgi:hypothetical protein